MKPDAAIEDTGIDDAFFLFGFLEVNACLGAVIEPCHSRLITFVILAEPSGKQYLVTCPELLFDFVQIAGRQGIYYHEGIIAGAFALTGYFKTATACHLLVVRFGHNAVPYKLVHRYA